MRSGPTSSISRFWANLDGAVHPLDRPIFDANPHHTFNLCFPPPAFVGAIDSAPIVILLSNGGYTSGVTEAEFPDTNSEADFRNYLRGEIAELPPHLASYYVNGRFSNWIKSGSAVIVNAVPYRSRRLSEEKENRRVAGMLQSLAVHRRWLTEEVLPEAREERRFVLVHRNGWWKVPDASAGRCILFSDPARAEPNRKTPDEEKLALAEQWLRRRG